MPTTHLKKRGIVVMIVLAVVTLGLYYPIWFLRRRQALNALDSPMKVPAWPFILLLIVLAINLAVTFAAAPGQPVDLIGSSAAALLGIAKVGALILTLIQCFRIRSILEDHLAGDNGPLAGTMLANQVQLSGLMTFLFTSFYLQYVINRDVLAEIAVPACPPDMIPRRTLTPAEEMRIAWAAVVQPFVVGLAAFVSYPLLLLGRSGPALTDGGMIAPGGLPTFDAVGPAPPPPTDGSYSACFVNGVRWGSSRHWFDRLRRPRHSRLAELRARSASISSSGTGEAGTECHERRTRRTATPELPHNAANRFRNRYADRRRSTACRAITKPLSERASPWPAAPGRPGIIRSARCSSSTARCG